MRHIEPGSQGTLPRRPAMARAEAAHASARPDSIKGLAQSVARPAYRRLLLAEPALRRAVPALIIAFLLSVGIGAIIQVHDRHRQALATAYEDIEAIAGIIADRLNSAADERDMAGDGAGGALVRALPPRATTLGRIIVLTDAVGTVIASAPARSTDIGVPLATVLGRVGAPAALDAQTEIAEATRDDGARWLVAYYALHAPNGRVVAMEPRETALAVWRSETVLTVTLFTTTGFVLLILGFAFHWQATRAREADLIYDTVRARIDTALNRGRCGLWDWDLARGRIFWSYSMFDIVGLEVKDDLLTFGEVSALVHPDDVKLYELAAQLADATTRSIDRAFRMRHAAGDWVWLRARCELIRQRDGADPHLIGIAVDITEQKDLMEKTIAADLRLRDAIETIPEAFVLWDADNRLVLCNSNFQELHDLPDEAIRAGTAYEAVVAAGRKPVVRTTGNHDAEPS